MKTVLFKQRFLLEGTMPERALLRLKRANITVYDVKKPQKGRLLFSVREKDGEKVFAIYPKTCYNINGYHPYKITYLGYVGLGKTVKKLQNRIGAIIGALLFAGVCLYANTMVFGVQVVGATDYKREALIALKQNGVNIFAPYIAGKEDFICSDILSCDGLEFCSVQKTGLWLRVEIRKGNFSKTLTQTGDMQSLKTGKILSIDALSGTPLKKVGDEVQKGEPLVGAWFLRINGMGDEVKTPTEVIARVKTECVFETTVQAEDAESAFCKAYLAAGLTGEEELIEKSVGENTENENGLFAVRIRYTAIQRWNL